MKPLIPLFLTLLCPLLATADESRPGAGDYPRRLEKRCAKLDCEGRVVYVQRMRDEMMKEREQE
ncbi:MAG: hypothetical protein P8Z31_11725 [Gammaproteobacteria bacterium]